QLNAAWATTNAAPQSADPIVTTVVNNTAISKNFKTLSTAVDADSDVFRVSEINGERIDYDNGNPVHVFEVDGKEFTFTKATQIVSADAQLTPHTWVGTFKLADDEGGETDALAWSI